MKDSSETDLPFSKLERCIHEPARLAVLSLLINADSGLSYAELRDRLNLTYGNLERHMKVLVEANMVSVEKVVTNGRSQSVAKFSDSGRQSFLYYLDNLEKILVTAQKRGAAQEASGEDLTGPAGEGSLGTV